MFSIRERNLLKKGRQQLFVTVAVFFACIGSAMAGDSAPRLVDPGPVPEFPLSRVAEGARPFTPAMPDEFVVGEMLVKFKERVSPNEAGLAQFNKEFDAELKHTHKRIGVHLFKLKKATTKEDTIKAIEELKKNPLVEFAEPNGIVRAFFTPNDTAITINQQYGLHRVFAFKAWDLTKGDPASYVAIVDSGVNWMHPDLAGKVDFPSEQLGNCVTPDTEPMDDIGHGTHVAGIAAAATNNGLGIAGVAFNERILAVKVLGAAGGGTWDSLACGLNIAAAIPEVKAINVSLGFDQPSSTVYNAVYNAWVTYGKTVVAANGNSATGYFYPACYSLNGIAIAVGATDLNNDHPTFSVANDCMTVSAPGADVSSTYSRNYSTRNDYSYRDGTSMAAPHVAGTVALMQAYRSRSNIAVRDNLISTALDRGTLGWDIEFGHGVINAYRAVGGAQISAGLYHTLSIKSGGPLWAWGDNYFSSFAYGQLGDGTTVDRHAPVSIATGTSWVAVSAGAYHTAALKTDGTVWTWGGNSYGQLGDGSTVISRTLPVQVGAAATWTAVKAGFRHTLALQANGTLWAWGHNAYGQLGNGTRVSRNTPLQIGTDTTWIDAAAGNDFSLGLKSDGTLWAWGYNFFGQLGDGSATDRLTPVQIGTDNTWSAVAAGGRHTLALQANGTLWAWGNNLYGQLGDGTTLQKRAPVQIGTDATWSEISAGMYHTAALKSDGTLWTWGQNVHGQLGDGTTAQKNIPVPIGTDTAWGAVAAGGYHTVALKSDGKVWAWGFNAYGGVGDGTAANKLVPTLIANTFKDPSRIGVFRGAGEWYLDLNGNGAWDGTPTDALYSFGFSGVTPVTGDWSGSGSTRIGVYDPASNSWYLDLNGNGAWDGTPADSLHTFNPGEAGSIPVAGDWSGSGVTKIGVYDPASNSWYLDLNGNGAWDGTPTDGLYTFDPGVTGAVPVTGDWNGTGITKIGLYLDGTWYLDINRNGAWDTDRDVVLSFGASGDIPVPGDWTGTRTAKTGVFISGLWYLDTNGTGVWEPGTDFLASFGVPGDLPVSGSW